MKSISTTMLTTISRKELKDLTTSVKETLATDLNSHVKVFTAADLWNIQRRKKSFEIRKNFA